MRSRQVPLVGGRGMRSAGVPSTMLLPKRGRSIFMKVGLVGLGRMGSGIAERLRAAGHDVVGYDADAARSQVGSLRELVAALTPPRVVWLMVPAGGAAPALRAQLAGVLSASGTPGGGGGRAYP